MFFTTRSFLSLSYRHSLHSTFTGIKSETKVHNIWVKDCNTIQCDHHLQTLATLNLESNQIGDEGAQYLGEALQHNTVRPSLFHVVSIISFFSLSYRHSLHSTLRAMKLELKVHNILSA